MQRRGSSRSSRKPTKRTTSPRKPCHNCLIKFINHIHISRSLYRKYSYSQNHFFLQRINQLDMEKSERESTADSRDEEYLNRYHKNNSRKIILNKIKEVYKMHRDIPRIFLSGVKDILFKCHHRKRLIQYFKLAKAMGIKVESLAFSSFMLSLHLNKSSKAYSRLLIDTSESSFAAQVRMLEAIGPKG